MIWNAVYLFAALLLVVFWRSKNSVWGTFTLGIVAGIITACILYFFYGSFAWIIGARIACIAAILGGLLETAFLFIRKK